MSLIINALNEKQRERAKQRSSEELRALEGFFPYATPASRSRRLTWRWLGAMAVALIVTGWTLALLVHRIRNKSPLPPTIDAPASPLGTRLAAADPTAGRRIDGQRVGSAANPASTHDVPARAAAPVPARGASAAVAGASTADTTVVRQTLGQSANQRPATLDAKPGKPAISSLPPASPPRPSGATLQGPPPRPVDRYVNEGIDAMEAGRWDAAEGYFASAQEIGTTRELFYNWGLARKHRGDFDGAADKLRRALLLDPTWGQALLEYAAVLDTLGRQSEATAILDKARQIEPGNAATILALAEQYLRLDNGLGGARQLAQEVTTSDPRNSRAHYLLARIMLRQADTTGAIRETNAFLQTAGHDYPQSTLDQISKWLRSFSREQPR